MIGKHIMNNNLLLDELLITPLKEQTHNLKKVFFELLKA